MLKTAFCAACAASLIAGPASAETVDDSAARFGVRASVLDISLSPSGNKIAYISAGPEHTEILNVVDLAAGTGVQPIITNSEKLGDLDDCEWAAETRLVCQMYVMGKRGDGTLVPFTRLIALDDDGGNVEQLTERQSSRATQFTQFGGGVLALDVAGSDGSILVSRQWVKDVTTGTRLANSKEGLGVDLIDIESGRRKVVEQPDMQTAYYLADETGAIRFKGRIINDARGYATDRWINLYRTKNDRDWRELGDVVLNGAKLVDFEPVAIDGANDLVYGFHNIDGYEALVAVSIDGTDEARLVMARSDVDIGGLMTVGRQRRIIGASYATERGHAAYFDAELKSLATSLATALPDQPLIAILGASADESKLLIQASSDRDPGTIYLYDKSSGQLNALLAVRRHLVDTAMGKMKPITYAASDGTQIPGYLTLPPNSTGKNMAAIVMPHGGPAARDVWGFQWLAQYFASRGYAVLQPNYRGSAGYGEAWLGKNGYQAWNVAIGDVNDAGRWLIDQGIADPDKLSIVGWSYGGYAALQSQVVDPDLFKAVVAIAPVTDLGFLLDDAKSYSGYRLRQEQIGDGPHIEAGSPQRHAAGFRAPVALFHGSRDINVDVRHSREMAERLRAAGKQVEYTEYEDLQHGLQDSRVRAQMLATIDAFLTRVTIP